MLLGCCHCDETIPSSSTPSSSTPSSSVPSESVISSSAEEWDCSNCDILPTNWTISGIDRTKWVKKVAYTDDLDCNEHFENGVILSNYTYAAYVPPTVPNNTLCATWTSNKKVINNSKYYTNPSPGGLHSPTCRESNWSTDWRWRLLLRRVNPMASNNIKFELTIRWGRDANQTQSSQIAVGSFTFSGTFNVPTKNCVTPFVFTTGVDNDFGSGPWTFTTTGHAITITPS